MGRKGVDCGCGAREDILDRLAALRQRVEVLETEINQIESEFPEVLRDVRSAEASAVSAAESAGASAEIVESYDERLGAVEQGVIDVNDYAEAIGDDVSALDTEIHTTRPYVDTNSEQTITGLKTVVVPSRIKNIRDNKTVIPTSQIQIQPQQVIGIDGQQIMFDQLITDSDGSRWWTKNIYGTNGTRQQIRLYVNPEGKAWLNIPDVTDATPSNGAVTKAFVQATDGRNNLLHTIGNEKFTGNKINEITNIGKTGAQSTELLTRGTIPTRDISATETLSCANGDEVITLIKRVQPNGVRVLRLIMYDNQGVGHGVNLVTMTADGVVTTAWGN